MKLDPRLPALPPLNELLEHPRVKAVVGRINRSTIAQRATGFLDELRESLAKRVDREGDVSLTQLAERLALRLLGEPAMDGPVVNATGLVIGGHEWHAPLPERALQRLAQTTGEFYPRAGENERVEALLCEAAGVEAAAVTNDFDSAERLAVKHLGVQIDSAPWAGVMNPAEFGLQPVETIGERIAAGADVVVIDGAGLLGGPACGIIAGKRMVVEAIKMDSLATTSAHPLALVALAATLEVFNEHGKPDAAFYLPTWQLLSAPLENLRQRAERLAAVITGSPHVAAAAAKLGESAWARWGTRELCDPSYSIVVTPQGISAASLAEQIARGPYPVMARVAGATLELDLRSVFPRWDQRLTAALEGN